jgi:hypothetical protein
MIAFPLAPAVLNEFVAYLDLREMVDQQAISQRAEIIATYALCGFSNFSSMGVQIGTTTRADHTCDSTCETHDTHTRHRTHAHDTHTRTHTHHTHDTRPIPTLPRHLATPDTRPFFMQAASGASVRNGSQIWPGLAFARTRLLVERFFSSSLL